MSRTNPALCTKIGQGHFARLQVLGKQHRIGPDKLAQRFALEAAIRRLFSSEHAGRFGVTSLKGGSLMFLSEGVDPIKGRATSDIDIQIDGFTGTMEDLTAIMRQVLADVPVQDDGVRFDVEGLRVIGTRDGGVPGGAVTCIAQVGQVVVKFKCDVGFYSIEHSATLIDECYPSLLPGQLPAIRIKRQPIEYAIVDKIHAAVQHAGGNTRLRDYYDLWIFCTRRWIGDDLILQAFRDSWHLYAEEAVPRFDEIENFGDGYAAEYGSTWDSLRAAWVIPVPDLQTVISTIRERLGPIVDQAAAPAFGVAA